VSKSLNVRVNERYYQTITPVQGLTKPGNESSEQHKYQFWPMYTEWQS